MQIITKLYIKLEVSVYHVNIQEGSPSHFSNKSYTLIKILPDQELPLRIGIWFKQFCVGLLM